MVSGTNDRWLTAETALRTIYPKMEPELFWLDMFPAYKEDQPTFMYETDTKGASGDPKKKKPSMQRVGAKFPEIDFSNETITPEVVNAKGFAYRISSDLLRGPPNGIRNQYLKAYTRAGQWLAEALNAEVLAAMKAGATTPNWNPTAVWSSSNATPSKDLILLKGQMHREGYPFKLNQVYVNYANFNELEILLADKDSSGNARAIWNAIQKPDDRTLVEPYSGIPVTYLDSGLNEGYILGIDTRNPVVEIHYFNNPEFATPNIRVQAGQNADGDPIFKNVKNFGLGFSTYKEDDTHDLVMQFMYDFKPVVTQSYGILYGSGI